MTGAAEELRPRTPRELETRTQRGIFEGDGECLRTRRVHEDVGELRGARNACNTPCAYVIMHDTR